MRCLSCISGRSRRLVDVLTVEDHLILRNVQAVGCELGDAQVRRSVRDVHRIIVINQQTAVIQTLADVVSLLPWSSWVLSGVEVGLVEVDTADPVPQAVALSVSDSAGPDTASIRPHAIVEIVRR